jgi:hypothetical protein
MSNKRKSAADSLPDVGDPSGAETAPPPAAAAKPNEQAPPPPEVKAVPKLAGLKVPRAQPAEKLYARRRFELALTPAQAAIAKRLYLGLQAEGTLLANGRKVRRPADAIAWLLEQVEGST